LKDTAAVQGAVSKKKHRKGQAAWFAFLHLCDPFFDL